MIVSRKKISFKNIELIIIHDASTDNSLSILESYSSIDQRIKIFTNANNSGLYYNRILGIKEAIGKYIIFLDSDDWLELNACEIIYKNLANNYVDVLEYGYVKEPFKEHNIINTEYNLYSILTDQISFTIWNKTYKTELLKKIPFKSFYLNYGEDAFLSIQISSKISSFRSISEYLHHYSFNTGISTQKIHDKQKVLRLCNDLSTMQKETVDFISSNFDEYMNLLNNFFKNRFDYLNYLADNDIYNTLENLKCIDHYFNTKYFQDKFIQIQHIIDIYDFLSKSTIKQKIKFLIKYKIHKGN